jgi:cobalt/nickel transport system permease protein
MHRLREVFSLGQATGDGRLACRYDVRVKLIVALATVCAVVLSRRMGFPLLVLAGCLAWLAVSRVPLGRVLGRLLTPLGLAAVICLVRTFLTGTTPVATWDLGLFHLTASREGLAAGALIGGRVLASVAVVMTLCLRTPALEVFAALRWAGLPQTLLEIALLMYRYIFVLFEQAASIVSAQKARLGYANYGRSMRSLGSLAGIVILRSLDQAERSYEAMLARGYHGSLPTPSLPALRKRQVAITWVCLTLVMLGFFLAERWPP